MIKYTVTVESTRGDVKIRRLLSPEQARRVTNVLLQIEEEQDAKTNQTEVAPRTPPAQAEE